MFVDDFQSKNYLGQRGIAVLTQKHQPRFFEQVSGMSIVHYHLVIKKDADHACQSSGYSPSWNKASRSSIESTL